MLSRDNLPRWLDIGAQGVLLGLFQGIFLTVIFLVLKNIVHITAYDWKIFSVYIACLSSSIFFVRTEGLRDSLHQALFVFFIVAILWNLQAWIISEFHLSLQILTTFLGNTIEFSTYGAVAWIFCLAARNHIREFKKPGAIMCIVGFFTALIQGVLATPVLGDPPTFNVLLYLGLTGTYIVTLVMWEHTGGKFGL